jgi:uncharacterized protein YdaU (DUF1376 family)
MSERPFMQLYVSDFVGDTLQLSTEHIGAYLLLLIALWNADGSLSSDEVKLARVTRLTVKKWRRVAVDLLPFFEVSDSILTHHRLTKELRKSEAQSNLRAIAGAKGGSANALKYNKATVASVSAGLKHAGASPEPYKKEAQSALDPTERPVKLSRYLEPELFQACEALTEKVPPYMPAKTWPGEIIAKAKAELAAQERPAA